MTPDFCRGKFPAPRPRSWGSYSVRVADLLCNRLAPEASATLRDLYNRYWPPADKWIPSPPNFSWMWQCFCIKFAIVIPKRDLAQLFRCRFQSPKPVANTTVAYWDMQSFLRPIFCAKCTVVHTNVAVIYIWPPLRCIPCCSSLLRGTLCVPLVLCVPSRKMSFSPIIRTTIFGLSSQICFFFFLELSAFPPSHKKLDLINFPSQFEWVFHPGVGTGD